MPLKARTPDLSVTPESLPASVVTGSDTAAGVRATETSTTVAASATRHSECVVHRYFAPAFACAARSARDVRM